MELAVSRPQVKAPEGQKHCYDCSTTKPVGDFNKDKSRYDGLNPYCRPCAKVRFDRWMEANPDKKRKIYERGYAKNKTKMLARTAAYRREMVQRLVTQFKSAPCMDCGVAYPPYVMDFDHRPGVEKCFILKSGNLTRYAIERVMEEIAKCDLVCSNCHRERTHRRRCEKGEQ